jgi:hypothetical protein
VNWFTLYVGVGIPVMLVLVGYGLARYARHDAHRSP